MTILLTNKQENHSSSKGFSSISKNESFKINSQYLKEMFFSVLDVVSRFNSSTTRYCVPETKEYTKTYV